MWHRVRDLIENRQEERIRYYHLVLLAENNQGYKNLMKDRNPEEFTEG